MTLMRAPLVLALAVLSLCRVSAAAPGVRVWGSVDDGPPAPAWVYARKGQKVSLHAQVSPAPAPGKAPQFSWYRIEPATHSLDNTRPSFHFANVTYETTELSSCRGQARCEVDVAPRLQPKNAHLEGLGTLAFQVRATLHDGTVLSSPGASSVDRGGLSREVFRVAIRRDDTYLGFLTELVNTPYIFGSDGPPGRHQADLLVGSDCADLAVYGIRRAGRDVPYVSTWTLEQHAPLVALAASRGGDGALLDARGTKIAVGPGGRVREGDLLLFPGTRHVAVLWEDRPPIGVLDEGDLMIHTCWAPPTVEPISASGCASLPVRVLRFR